jgi:tetratricopeptide (TPR) repeat protein
LWSNLAYAHYVLGNLEQCREAFDKALERDAPWSAHWHFAALLAAREGKTDEAKDWYFAADEWLKRDPPTLPVFRWVRSLAATELRLPAELTASDNPAEHLARYDRLLAKYSGVGMLHYRRGLWNGQRGAWPDAQADFQRASQHAPHVSNTWHALGVVALYREDVAAYEAACRRALNAGLELSAPARLALLCTLSPTSDQPYDRITAMAQRVYSATQEETARKALLMAHLRAGNHDRAFDLAPTTESTPIGWLQLALLHQQLGNEYTYRRFRAKAEEAIAKQIPTPAGHDPDGDDRPLEWCVIQILLRELQAGDAAQKK